MLDVNQQGYYYMCSFSLFQYSLEYNYRGYMYIMN